MDLSQCYSYNVTVGVLQWCTCHITSLDCTPLGPNSQGPWAPQPTPRPTPNQLACGINDYQSASAVGDRQQARVCLSLQSVVSCQRDCFTPTYAVNAISMYPVNRPICIWKYCKDAVCVLVDFCSVILLLISRFDRCKTKKRSRF